MADCMADEMSKGVKHSPSYRSEIGFETMRTLKPKIYGGTASPAREEFIEEAERDLLQLLEAG
jgi:hypothetical protein